MFFIYIESIHNNQNKMKVWLPTDNHILNLPIKRVESQLSWEENFSQDKVGVEELRASLWPWSSSESLCDHS